MNLFMNIKILKMNKIISCMCFKIPLNSDEGDLDI